MRFHWGNFVCSSPDNVPYPLENTRTFLPQFVASKERGACAFEFTFVSMRADTRKSRQSLGCVTHLGATCTRVNTVPHYELTPCADNTRDSNLLWLLVELLRQSLPSFGVEPSCTLWTHLRSVTQTRVTHLCELTRTWGQSHTSSCQELTLVLLSCPKYTHLEHSIFCKRACTRVYES